MRCPRCEQQALEVLCHVAHHDTQVGTCVIRCTHCSHGAWVSRMLVPEASSSGLAPEEWPETVFDE